jgi:hypothetical protein
MTRTEVEARQRLAETLSQLDQKNHFNGGQTVRPVYAHGSDARANLIAEADFWLRLAQDQEGRER